MLGRGEVAERFKAALLKSAGRKSRGFESHPRRHPRDRRTRHATTGEPMHEGCSHTGAINPVAAPRDVCERCVEVGSTWVHLRQCVTCARTLCCNDSPNRHMTAHFGETGHPIMRGADPGDQWTWCFADDAMIRPTAAGWETYDPFVEAGFPMAQRHLEGGGTADPGEDLVTPEGFPLGDWFAYLRELHDAGELDASDATRAQALPGWRW
jgi:hypothetical protein